MNAGKAQETAATWLEEYAMVLCKQRLLWSSSFLRSMYVYTRHSRIPELSAYYGLGSMLAVDNSEQNRQPCLPGACILVGRYKHTCTYFKCFI